MRTVVIDIDNCLNNFDETLRTMEFDTSKLKNIEKLDYYIDVIRKGEVIEKDRTFDGVCRQLHLQAYETAKVRPNAAEVVQKLKKEGWRVCILTARDLRYCLDETVKWLKDNEIPYDFLFKTHTCKALFCKVHGVDVLIDDMPLNILVTQNFGIRTFYPITDYNQECGETGFHDWSELYELK